MSTNRSNYVHLGSIRQLRAEHEQLRLEIDRSERVLYGRYEQFCVAFSWSGIVGTVVERVENLRLIFGAIYDGYRMARDIFTPNKGQEEH